MGEISPLLLAGTAALQGLGALKQGRDEAATAKYNADVAKLEGQAAVEEAASQEQIKRSQIRSTLSRQRLLASASGAGLGGSFEDVAAGAAREGELDALAIRMGGQLAKSRAVATAALYKEQGRQAKSTGLLRALTFGLAGGSDAYSAYLRSAQNGTSPAGAGRTDGTSTS